MTPADISLIHVIFWTVFSASLMALLAYDLAVMLLDLLPDFLQVIALFVVSVWRGKKS